MAWVKIADRSTYWEIGNAGDYTTPRPEGDVRGYWRIYYDNAPDIANNRTKIKTEYCIQVNNSYNASGLSSNSKIAGSNNIVSVPNGYYYPGVTQYTTGEVWVTHDAYGNGSFTWQGLSSGAAYFDKSTGVSTYYLPNIPRYATINSFTFDKASGAAGLSTLTCGWSANASCDAVQYSLNGGGWISSGTSGTSGSFNISGLTPNTQYSLRIRVKRTDSQLWTESGTLYATTYDIAKITSADSINDDGTPYITFSNPSGAVINAHIGYAGTYIDRLNIPNTGSYIFTLTTAERNLLRAACTTNQMAIAYVIATEVSGTPSYWHPLTKTFTITNANPTFTTWTYADTNAATLALTGSNQKIIKGYSNVKATIISANKMVAIKGATATSYQLTIGAKNATVAYSSGSTVEMTINAVDNNVFNCYAIDSRGNSTNVIKTLTTDYINYTPISITSATATRTNDIGTQTTLAFSGNIFDGSFGSVSNSVKSATYKFKKTTDVSYTDGTSVITPTKTGGAFSFSGTIKGDAGSGGVNGFDATYSYNIQVIVTDELSTHTFNFVLGSGKPNIAIHQDGIAINQAYDETLGGALQVNGPAYINGSQILKENDIVDNLTSTSTTDPLSAKQGKVLNDKIIDSGWINASLENGWSNVSNRTTQYRKIGSIVYVRGTITGGTKTAHTTLFTLPVGYRAAQDNAKALASCYNGSTVVLGYLILKSSGEVRPDIDLPTNTEVGLYFSFVAD